MTLAGLTGGYERQTEEQEQEIISISDALRILPSNERGEKYSTGIVLVRGMISSVRPVIKMPSGRYSKCPQCGHSDYIRFLKPVFRARDGIARDRVHLNIFCEQDSDKHEVMRDKQDKIVYDENGLMMYRLPMLDIWYDYRNASIIELQDIDKFDDLERLQVILFDDDTREIRAGEQILVTGEIYIEKFNERDSSLQSRVYSHSIAYESRREISLTSQNVNAIKCFVAMHGNKIVDMGNPIHCLTMNKCYLTHCGQTNTYG
jgi:hypothetical protein